MKRCIALVFACISVLCLIACSADKEENNVTNDYPPMIMFNDTLYSTTDDYNPNKDELTVVGKVESFIDGKPTENNQANDDLVGCDIYTTPNAPNHVFVLYNGVYSAYKTKPNNAEQTPPESVPDTITKDNGTVETFKYDNLVLEVSNVKEIRKESSFDGMETWEYDVYVLYPGATLKVLEPDTFIDEESGLDHANWAIYLADSSRIDIDKEMNSLELNEKIIGVYDPESSVYVLGFEMYDNNGG